MGKLKNWSLFSEHLEQYVNGKYWVHDYLLEDCYAVTSNRTVTAVMNRIDPEADNKQTLLAAGKEQMFNNTRPAVERLRRWMKEGTHEDMTQELLDDVQKVLGVSKKDAKAIFKNERIAGVPGKYEFNLIVGEFDSFKLARHMGFDNKVYQVDAFFVPEGGEDVREEDSTVNQDTYVKRVTTDGDSTIESFTSQEKFRESIENDLERMIDH